MIDERGDENEGNLPRCARREVPDNDPVVCSPVPSVGHPEVQISVGPVQCTVDTHYVSQSKGFFYPPPSSAMDILFDQATKTQMHRHESHLAREPESLGSLSLQAFANSTLILPPLKFCPFTFLTASEASSLLSTWWSIIRMVLMLMLVIIMMMLLVIMVM